MERLGTKEKHGFRLKAEQRKELLVELGRKRDWKSQKARENFERPAFFGTALKPRGSRKTTNKEGAL